MVRGEKKSLSVFNYGYYEIIIICWSGMFVLLVD